MNRVARGLAYWSAVWYLGTVCGLAQGKTCGASPRPRGLERRCSSPSPFAGVPAVWIVRSGSMRAADRLPLEAFRTPLHLLTVGERLAFGLSCFALAWYGVVTVGSL